MKSATLDTVAYIALGVFLLLFGVFSVTNFQVEWGKPIMGFSALIAGVVLLIRAFVPRT